MKRNQNPLIQKGKNFLQENSKETKIGQSIVFSAEVLDIILDSNHPDYSSESDIGLIKFRSVGNATTTNPRGYALPISPYFKKFPLIHEIVIVFRAQSNQGGVTSSATTYYYSDIVNMWSLTNYNPAPFSTRSENEIYPSAINDYIDPVDTPVNSSPSIDFGEYFKEKGFIPDLQPFEGDVVIQGRFGNTIRFGSTIKEKQQIISWSKQGETGDPIIIIRNHNLKQKEDRYVIEDINKDSSSIYICDGQMIPLKISNPSQKSYGTNKIQTPKKITDFFGKQILMNSDRLVLNAKNDSVFISAKESVSLSSIGTINLESKKPIIAESPEYYFGVNAQEKGVLGDTLVDLLKELTQALQQLTVSTPSGPSSTPVNISSFIQIEQKLKTILSKRFYIE